jgi:hypothetical protein
MSTESNSRGRDTDGPSSLRRSDGSTGRPPVELPAWFDGGAQDGTRIRWSWRLMARLRATPTWRRLSAPWRWLQTRSRFRDRHPVLSATLGGVLAFVIAIALVTGVWMLWSLQLGGSDRIR